MNFSLTKLLEPGPRQSQWLAALIGILVFAALNLIVTLLLPQRWHPAVVINALATILAIILAPLLLRTFDRMQQRVVRQNNELRSLHAIDNAISAELDLQTILNVAVKQMTLAVDGEMGALWLLDEAAAMAPSSEAYYNVLSEMQPTLRERLSEGTTDLARRTGVPQRRVALEEEWVSNRLLDRLHLRNVIAIPIKQQESVLGVLMVGNRGGALTPLEGFSREDEKLLEAISATVVVAVQNARLYQETVRRDELLRGLVARTGDAIAASSDAPLLMQILADEAARILSCRRVAVYAFQEDAQEFHPLAAHDDSATRDETGQGRALLESFFSQPLPREGLRLPVSVAIGGEEKNSPAHYVANAPEALGLLRAETPFLDSPGYVFTLRSRDQRGIGLLCLLDSAPRLRTPDAAASARALAAQASLALENAQLFANLQASYERERRIAETLQRSLLPPVPAQLGVFDLAYHYQAGLEESLIGGDFLDLFDLGEDRLGIVIADVSGKGLSAAVQTAMIKYTLRGFALETPSSPGSVLARVNDVVCSPMSSHDGFVTLFYGVLNTQNGEFAYANAGHEPPLLRAAGMQTVSDLSLSDGMALGCLAGQDYPQYTATLQAGDLLLLHTDGLTEARAENGEFMGQSGLKDLMPRADLPAAIAIKSIYEQVRAFAADILRDDVAMLLLRRLPE